ncbi:unnamed protein product, partial [Meganyctiphanes norvegica]
NSAKMQKIHDFQVTDVTLIPNENIVGAHRQPNLTLQKRKHYESETPESNSVDESHSNSGVPPANKKSKYPLVLGEPEQVASDQSNGDFEPQNNDEEISDPDVNGPNESMTDNRSSESVKNILVSAVQTENALSVNRALQEGADPNTSDQHGTPLLVVAAKNGYINICRLLLQHKANPDAKDHKGCHSIYWGASEGHQEVVKLIIESGGNPQLPSMPPGGCGRLASDIARRHGHRSLATWLESQIKLDTENMCKSKDLVFAVKAGDAPGALCALQQGANPNMTCSWGICHAGAVLCYAVSKEYTDVVKSLLEAKTINVDMHGDTRYTALFEAVLLGNDSIAHLLLSKGADSNKPSGPHSRPPLVQAALDGDLEMCHLLLQQGANPDATDIDGCILFCP